jgi:hypothetical protein
MQTGSERVFSKLLSICMQNGPVIGLKATANYYVTIARITVLLVALTAAKSNSKDKIRFMKSFVLNFNPSFPEFCDALFIMLTLFFISFPSAKYLYRSFGCFTFHFSFCLSTRSSRVVDFKTPSTAFFASAQMSCVTQRDDRGYSSGLSTQATGAVDPSRS